MVRKRLTRLWTDLYPLAVSFAPSQMLSFSDISSPFLLRSMYFWYGTKDDTSKHYVTEVQGLGQKPLYKASLGTRKFYKCFSISGGKILVFSKKMLNSLRFLLLLCVSGDFKHKKIFLNFFF